MATHCPARCPATAALAEYLVTEGFATHQRRRCRTAGEPAQSFAAACWRTREYPVDTVGMGYRAWPGERCGERDSTRCRTRRKARRSQCQRQFADARRYQPA